MTLLQVYIISVLSYMFGWFWHEYWVARKYRGEESVNVSKLALKITAKEGKKKSVDIA